jgi:hypothetical protein
MLYELSRVFEYVAEYCRAGCIVNGNRGMENMQVPGWGNAGTLVIGWDQLLALTTAGGSRRYLRPMRASIIYPENA